MGAILETSNELSKLLEPWTSSSAARQDDPSFDPVPTLTRMSEIIEKETESYYKMDPDPFDDRHPSRARPDCSLGALLKMLFKNDDFMTKLVSNYVMHRDNIVLQTAACRLLIDLLPGLETSVVFHDTEGLVERLFQNAEFSEEPLKSYSIGLLAAAMDVQDIAVNFKDQNMHLVPVLLRRLKDLSAGRLSDSGNSDKENKTSTSQDGNSNANIEPPVALNSIGASSAGSDSIVNSVTVTNSNDGDGVFERPFAAFKRTRSPDKVVTIADGDRGSTSGSLPSPVSKRRRISSPSFSPASFHTESNSSWADLEPLIVGSFSLHPLTPEMQQRFILQYLTPMGDYQELLYHIFEEDALGLILHYIELEKNHDIRLAFEALKYLSSLLCHKKFALEFLNRGGLQKLLQVYRPSVAATGVSICLYYLAYSEDAMERICLLPKPILTELVSYSLWLLECSHDSSRCHATMFFSFSFAFRVILDLFDSQDGLRKLLNAMFLLDIFADDTELNDDELIQKRQTARHVCVALKKYFEAHLVLESERLRRNMSSPTGIPPRTASISSSQSTSSSSSSGQQGCKATRYSPEKIYEHVENLLELIPVRYSWKPVDELMKLGGVRLLITLVGASTNWGFTGKQEAIRSAMDVLVICSVVPKMQLLFKELVTNEDNIAVPGKAIILACLQPDRLAEDPEVAQSALRIVINCVCGPGSRFLSTNAGQSGHHRHPSMSSKKKSSLSFRFRSELDHLLHMWKVVKENDGLPILLSLLTTTTPITEADAIRTLACKALTGLSNYEEVRQIIAKRPIFNNGQLQALMKEPVLQDKRNEHVKFIKYCVELIHQVTGSHPVIEASTIDTSTPENLNRAEVVAQTKIMFNDKQLFELMYDYLVKKGLLETAKLLSREAELPLAAPRIKPSPWPIMTPTPAKGTATDRPSFSCPTTPSGSMLNLSTQGTLNGLTTTPVHSISFKKSNLHRSMSIGNRVSRVLPFMSKPTEVDGEGYTPSPVIKKIESSSQMSSTTPIVSSSSLVPNKSITLDSIITEYLRKQHALCKNPIVTCPTFDLFTPHRCPEGKNVKTAPLHMALRVQKKQLLPKFGGVSGQKYDRRFVYSKFRPIKTFKEAEGAHSFTACAFSFVDQYLLLGTSSGEMAVFNMDSGSLVTTYNCHDSELKYIEPSRDGKSIITCSIWRSPISALWSFTDVFDMKVSFDDDYHVEYGKLYQDKALGTHHSAAHLYDLNVGRRVSTFHDESISRKYLKNEATFSYTDELILNDGVLWDVRTSDVVHKFDKFNDSINGVFHPNGFEIIANSEIWDMRTYRLLRTVPALDQCSIRFNPTGDVIYGAVLEADTPEDDESRSPYTSSFRTFDASDYSSIATIDVKKSICDLAVDPEDNLIAIIEMDSRREVMFNQDNVCRLYEVGRSKEEDEEADDDEDDDDEDNDDDMDEDDSEDDILDTTDNIRGHHYGHYGSSDEDDDEDGELDDDDDELGEYESDESEESDGSEDDDNNEDSEWTSVSEDEDEGDDDEGRGQVDELINFVQHN